MRTFIRLKNNEWRHGGSKLTSDVFHEVDDLPGLVDDPTIFDTDRVFEQWSRLMLSDTSKMTSGAVRVMTDEQKNYFFRLSYRILQRETSFRSRNWIVNGTFGFSRLRDQTNLGVITIFPAARHLFRAVVVKGSSIPHQIAVISQDPNDKVTAALLAITSYILRNALRFSDGTIDNHHIEKAVNRWNRNYTTTQLLKT